MIKSINNYHSIISLELYELEKRFNNTNDKSNEKHKLRQEIEELRNSNGKFLKRKTLDDCFYSVFDYAYTKHDIDKVEFLLSYKNDISDYYDKNIPSLPIKFFKYIIGKLSTQENFLERCKLIIYVMKAETELYLKYSYLKFINYDDKIDFIEKMQKKYIDEIYLEMIKIINGKYLIIPDIAKIIISYLK